MLAPSTCQLPALYCVCIHTGAVIHWKETPESAMLTAAMLERLRSQLPMAVNNFDSVGHIFSAGAADAALAAAAAAGKIVLCSSC